MRKAIILTIIAALLTGVVIFGGCPQVGDGGGRVEVTTSGGIFPVWTGLDTIHYFGRAVDARRLIAVVAKRNAEMKGASEVPYEHKTTRGEYKVMLAASLLGKVKEPEAFPHLLMLVEDPYSLMRGWAATALKELGDRRALPALLKVLKEEKSCNGRLCPAIGALGDNSAVPALIDTIPAGGAMDTEERFEAIEQITGLSLADMRREWGRPCYGETHQKLLEAMRDWWTKNKHLSRNGEKTEPPTQGDGAKRATP